MKNKQLLENIKQELKYLGMLFVIAVIMFKIIFYKEGFIILLRMVFSLFYIIILPGYFIMLYWIEDLQFKERIIVGIAAATAVVGLTSYYLGILGLHIKYHVIPLPLVVIVFCFLLNYLFKK